MGAREEVRGSAVRAGAASCWSIFLLGYSVNPPATVNIALNRNWLTAGFAPVINPASMQGREPENTDRATAEYHHKVDDNRRLIHRALGS